MAMDVGMSHPDLFAGVVAMGPAPKWQNMFMDYWKNAQKLPFYVVTGELAGDSVGILRRHLRQWMPKGFPGILVALQGPRCSSGSARTAVIFDWMGRKSASPAPRRCNWASNRYPWATMRETTTASTGSASTKSKRASDGNLRAGTRSAGRDHQATSLARTSSTFGPAASCAFSVWLTQELIDWTKQVYVNINAGRREPPAKVFEPDLEVLLEDYRERGDRRVLVLGHLEFNATR